MMKNRNITKEYKELCLDIIRLLIETTKKKILNWKNISSLLNDNDINSEQLKSHISNMMVDGFIFNNKKSYCAYTENKVIFLCLTFKNFDKKVSTNQIALFFKAGDEIEQKYIVLPNIDEEQISKLYYLILLSNSESENDTDSDGIQELRAIYDSLSNS